MSKTKWKDTPLLHKVVTIISVLASLSVVVLAVLQMFDIWDQAINVFMPLMGITMLCQAYMQWNNSRKVAYFSIGTAAFISVARAQAPKTPQKRFLSRTSQR